LTISIKDGAQRPARRARRKYKSWRESVDKLSLVAVVTHQATRAGLPDHFALTSVELVGNLAFDYQ